MGPPVMISACDIAEQMHMSRATVYELARRADDPLPLRTLDGFKRSSAALVSELEAWYLRNSKLFKEVER